MSILNEDIFKWIWAIFFLAICCTLGYSQDCDANRLEIHEIRPSQTDPNISFELNTHLAFHNPDCAPQNKLLIYMVGTFGNPKNNQLFPSLAANSGFHVISLKYPNNRAALQVCAEDEDSDCYEDFRREALYGTDLSAGIEIDTTNSILNRATKLVMYLQENYPNENWGQYLEDGAINWPQVVLAGHSQGSGHAAFIGQQFKVSRVLMFAGPNEYSVALDAPAAWLTKEKATPDSSFYAFGSEHDEVVSFAEQILAWEALGLDAFGDSLAVENADCPYQDRRILYTSQLFLAGLIANHGSVVTDDHTPVDEDGMPEFSSVWHYMLGVCATVTSAKYLSDYLGHEVYPNPVEDVVTFTIHAPQVSRLTLTIYDYSGRVVRSAEVAGSSVAVDLHKLAAGVYFYTITDDKKEGRAAGRFVKVDAH